MRRQNDQVIRPRVCSFFTFCSFFTKLVFVLFFSVTSLNLNIFGPISWKSIYFPIQPAKFSPRPIFNICRKSSHQSISQRGRNWSLRCTNVNNTINKSRNLDKKLGEKIWWDEKLKKMFSWVQENINYRGFFRNLSFFVFYHYRACSVEIETTSCQQYCWRDKHTTWGRYQVFGPHNDHHCVAIRSHK